MKRRLTRKKRIGLLGGTFDPVHLGHINIGQSLCDKGLIEQVIFVPVRIPPHKLQQPISSKTHRLAMLRLALGRHENFHISRFEIRRSTLSYTIDTARHYFRYFRNNLYLIIGMDSLWELNTWYEAKTLVRNYNFMIYKRPGVTVPNQSDLCASFGRTDGKKLYNSIVEGVVTDVSASLIRSLVRKRNDVSQYLPSAVFRYISEKKLYRE